ncbi:helix-turn-helix transcriptional regulator [Enorma phocaeensis]|uniref:helix-turn-helix transcriptional regulator n=1 Tax=Enorma phocaeensis TaxID=1871019 RepID=UPI000C834768|nr:helix-turn-helix transcriptional regulator [Enorma phocaeensis]
MEIGHRIKSYRTQLGMSQDALAERVYVSRQTISSWENDKTYPDVQSLLILSEVFGATIDDLVKGDVEAMTKTLDTDAKTMLRLGFVMLAFLLLMILALVWVSVQLIVWDWPTEQTVPTIVLALVLWGVAMFAAVWSERLKKEHDLVTYQEVLSFMTGKDVDRATEKGRRERLIPTWMKVIRAVGTMLIAAAIGAFVGYNGAALMDLLLG